MQQLLETVVGAGAAEQLANWAAVSGGLPPEITLTELILYLETDSESEQTLLLERVRRRAAARAAPDEQAPVEPKRIRLLTMHGAKGLDGCIVFIPWMEQYIVPSRRALRAVGLVMEQRRLFYVALTRSKAVCVISHAVHHEGPLAFAIAGRAHVDLPRSQFVNELGVGASVNRAGGLSPEEAARFVAEVDKL